MANQSKKMNTQNDSSHISDNSKNRVTSDVNGTKNSSNHWHDVYKDADITKLGWYENESTPSLQLIEKCNLAKKDLILNVGAGSTTLIDSLLEYGYTNLIANDISGKSLNTIKDRLGKKQHFVKWIVDDIINPTELEKIPQVDLWNDRAVLHFFVEEKDQDAYFDLLDQKVCKNGYAILAVFNLEGAKRCSGLPVKRYSVNMLQEKLGSRYILKESFNYIYTMPNGEDRDFVYTLFQKTN